MGDIFHNPFNDLVTILYRLVWLMAICKLQVSPAYLHANSTSHTWPFSAIAELIGKLATVS